MFILVHSTIAQQAKYKDNNNSWNAGSLGNHRVMLQFNSKVSVAKVIIPWRRHDDPSYKRVIVQDAATGKNK